MSLLRFFRRRRSDRDLAREIAAHFNEERAENIARGLSPEEADRQAHIKFGSPRRVHEDLWQQNSFAWVEGILRDLKYALRSLAHAPGFAITVILIMALGIGANTAVFSVMNAVLLKSLPVADPQRVLYLRIDGQPDGATNTGNSDSSFSWPVYDALRHQDRAFSDVIAYVPLSNDGRAAVRIDAAPEVAGGDMVSGNFFSGLGVRMARARAFTDDDEKHHAPIAVLSYNYWTRRFSRSPGALGRTLYVKGVPLTVVGITAAGFEGTEPGASVDFWIPLQSRAELNAWGDPAADGKTYLVRQDWWCLPVLARLAPGATAQQALAQTQAIVTRTAFIGLGHPRVGQKPPIVSFQPAKAFPGYAEQYGTPLKMMMAMVALVLVIALSNVAMLLIARNANRQREFSVRLSLGAGRPQLFRQLLTEAALLVACGGSLAWLFACSGTRALAAWAQIDSSLAPDATALWLTLAILVLAALLFGLAPLRTSLAGGTGLVLKSSSAVANQTSGRSRSARVVVALQMAFCLSLLVGAGLLVRTLRNLENTPLGLRTSGLVAFGISPQHIRKLDERIAFYQLLLSRLRALPGVEDVSLAENRPGSGWSSNDSAPMVDGHKPPNSDGEQGMVRRNTVGPDFFQTLGVPILTGRDFVDADMRRSANVVIVNQTFARRFLPSQDPVGHSIGNRDWTEHVLIVGVVKDHKYTTITEKPIPMFWTPYTNGDVGELHVEMRVAGDPLAILPAAQNAVRQIDPNLPLLQPMLQQQQFEQSISAQILFARLAECFGLLAVVLVATGIYGTLAYRVSRRTAEIGVRMALGARRSQVVWMILESTLWLTLLGVVIGAPLAILISRTLASALYQVKPFDALSYIGAVLCLALVSLAASAIPAQRAARLDPAKALRTE
jgi:predicted permease